jgi:hypothetical protein
MARNGRMGEDGMVAAARTSSAWERYAWAAGILYVIALVAETVVGVLGGGASQNASAAKIANALYDHRGRLLVIACLSVVYAAMFLIYLAKLYDLLRRDTDRSRFLGSLVLTGGALFIVLHAVSLLSCMPSATSVSSVCSARSSRRSGSTTIRACPTRCTC